MRLPTEPLPVMGLKGANMMLFRRVFSARMEFIWGWGCMGGGNNGNYGISGNDGRYGEDGRALKR